MLDDQDSNQAEPTPKDKTVDSVGQNQSVQPSDVEPPMAEAEAAAIDREPETTMSPVEAPAPVAPVSAFGSSPMSAIEPSQEMGMQPKKGGKKKFIFAGIAAAILVLLGGGGALAYTMYQNPEKVLIDGIVNTFSTLPTSGKATLVYTGKDTSVNVSFDGKRDEKIGTGTVTFKYDDKKNSTNLEGSADFAATVNGDGYIKINDLDKLAKTAIDAMVDSQVKYYQESGQALTQQQISQMKEQAYNEFKPTIDKINNKWIKFPADKSDGDTGEKQKCVSDTMKKLKADKAMRDELTKVYTANKFIIIKDELGVKDGSYGFRIDFDNAKAKSFGDAVEKTAFGKAIDKCVNPEGDSKSSDDLSSAGETKKDDSPFKNSVFDVWISQWSHQITKVSLSGDMKDEDGASFKLDASMDYKPVTGLSEPKDAVDYKDLMDQEEAKTANGSSSAGGLDTLSTSLLTHSF